VSGQRFESETSKINNPSPATLNTKTQTCTPQEDLLNTEF